MGNFIPPADKAVKSVEAYSFDLEGNSKYNGELPEYWPVGGRIYCKFWRDPLYTVSVYSKGPIVSKLYTSKSAVVTQMKVDFRESKL